MNRFTCTCNKKRKRKQNNINTNIILHNFDLYLRKQNLSMNTHNLVLASFSIIWQHLHKDVTPKLKLRIIIVDNDRLPIKNYAKHKARTHIDLQHTHHTYHSSHSLFEAS